MVEIHRNTTTKKNTIYDFDYYYILIMMERWKNQALYGNSVAT